MRCKIRSTQLFVIAAFGSFFKNIFFDDQVSKWIREIQKVTKLDRDPSSGTALQVHFSFIISFLKLLI